MSGKLGEKVDQKDEEEKEKKNRGRRRDRRNQEEEEEDRNNKIQTIPYILPSGSCPVERLILSPFSDKSHKNFLFLQSTQPQIFETGHLHRLCY